MMPSKELQNERKVESSEAKSLESKIQIACLNRNADEAIKLFDEAETLNVKKLDEKGVLFCAVENIENDTLVNSERPNRPKLSSAEPRSFGQIHRSFGRISGEKYVKICNLFPPKIRYIWKGPF